MAIYYASGTNDYGEIRGAAQAGLDIGTAAPNCLQSGSATGLRCEHALIEVGERYPALRLFIDSGAFSEVSDQPDKHKKAGLKPENGVLKTVAPITTAQWELRLSLMQRVGKVYGQRLLIMAPDKIADQQETLRRLRWFRRSGWLDRMRRLDVEIAVVMQGGELDPIEFDRQASKVLGWKGYTVAFPMAKGATALPQIEDFLQRRKARRVHLLGIGPKARKRKSKPSGKMVQRKLFDAYPQVSWSWDSTLLRQAVSRDPKRLAQGTAQYTSAADYERARLRDPALERLDFTELGPDPSLWLLSLWGWQKAQKCLAELREYEAKQTRLGSTSKSMKRSPRIRTNTPGQRAAWSRKLAKWAKCRSEFEAEAFKTGRAIGVPESELSLFAYEPTRYAYSRFPGLAGGWDKNNPRFVYDTYFADGLEQEFSRWAMTPWGKGGPPDVAQLLKERAVYRAFRDHKITVPGQRGIAGLRLP